MNKHPSSAGGDTEPIKSIPMWCQGAFTGTGLSSGTPLVNFLLIHWQTSQVYNYHTCRCIQIVLTISITSLTNHVTCISL